MACVWLVFAGYDSSHPDVDMPVVCNDGALFLVVDIPVGTQRQIFMVHAAQQAIEIPQLLVDKVVDFPVVQFAGFPVLSWRRQSRSQRCCSLRKSLFPGAVVEETVEISQLPLLRKSSFPGGADKVVDMLACV